RRAAAPAQPGRRRRRAALQLINSAHVLRPRTVWRIRYGQTVFDRPPNAGLPEVVGGEEVGLERGREGVRDVLHVLPHELLEDPVQRLGAGVELLVIGVDLALAVDGLVVPTALRATPPEAPVAAVSGLLPVGRLDEARAAPVAEVQGGRLGLPDGRLLGLGVTCAVHIYLTQETANQSALFRQK